MKQVPWEYNSDLSEERLTKMANFIARVRDDVIELHDEELGDTRLALGMRAYECCRTRIIDLSKDDSFPWLSILTPEGRFTFANHCPASAIDGLDHHAAAIRETSPTRDNEAAAVACLSPG